MNNNWGIPQELYNELNKEFNFTIDLCATKKNSKCKIFSSNYFKLFFHNNTIHKCGFMNPPYSNPKPFIKKAWEDSKYLPIVCLVKCDPSTKWWSIFWNYTDEYVRCKQCFSIQKGKYLKNIRYCAYCSACPRSRTTIYNGPKPGCEVRFFPKRIKLTSPKNFKGKITERSFVLALIIMDRRT